MKAFLIHPNATTETSPYDPEFIKKIQSGREAVKEGKGTKIAYYQHNWYI